MEAVLRHFLDQIPDQYADVKILASKKILLMKPDVYVSNVVLETQNYNFIFPTSVPPPTWLGKREYQFHRDSMIALEPEVTVLVKNTAPTRKYKSLCIDRDFFQAIAWQITGKREVTFKEREYACLSQVLQAIAQFEDEVSNSYGECPLMLESICVQMIIQILRATGVSIVKQSEKIASSHNYVSKAIEYMHSYFSANIKIDDICRDINLSRYHFVRLFKSQTGKTPHAYLMGLRLKHAETMLRSSANSVEEVAYLCGFINFSHFSAFFRHGVGISPSEYRKRWGQKKY